MNISLNELSLKLADLKSITEEYYINESQYVSVFGEENRFLFSKWDFF